MANHYFSAHYRIVLLIQHVKLWYTRPEVVELGLSVVI